jgi:hypothetical protein
MDHKMDEFQQYDASNPSEQSTCSAVFFEHSRLLAL